MITTIIVDDEPVAQRGLKKYVLQVPELQLAAICENVIEAEEVIAKTKVDIMLLDIQMPYVNGIDFLRKIGKHKPLTIIISAYPNYALEGFDLEVVDYLIKPVDFERFKQAISKALALIAYKQAYQAQQVSAQFLLIKTNKSLERIAVNDILFIEALHNYIAIHTHQQKFIVYQSLKGIEQELPPDLFLKVHKSFIVALNKIRRIVDGAKLDVGISTQIPISRSNKSELLHIIRNTIAQTPA